MEITDQFFDLALESFLEQIDAVIWGIWVKDPAGAVQVVAFLSFGDAFLHHLPVHGIGRSEFHVFVVHAAEQAERLAAVGEPDAAGEDEHFAVCPLELLCFADLLFELSDLFLGKIQAGADLVALFVDFQLLQAVSLCLSLLAEVMLKISDIVVDL